MIREKINNLIREMSRGAYEREEVIALSLLSAMAGESIFLLGLPGVGKSMVARRLKSAFRNSTCFEYLMSRFSTPDEIFGPVSISKLKDSDTYERCVQGYLPTADVVFLDEIWKAGPAIQNSLLTALNEKIFHNGKTDMCLPLKGIIAASNELPAEGEGLEALWDRFLIRYIVQPINDKDAFMKLIGGDKEVFCMPDQLALSDEEYDAIKDGINSVTIPQRVIDALYELSAAKLDMGDRYFLIKTGERGAIQFHKEILREVSGWSMFTMNGDALNVIQKADSPLHQNALKDGFQFVEYMAPNGITLKLEVDPYYDDPVRNKIQHPLGGPAFSYRYDIMDIGTMDQPNIFKCTVKDEPEYRGYQWGPFRNPFTGEANNPYASFDEDAAVIHKYATFGVCVLDPTRTMSIIPAVLQG